MFQVTVIVTKTMTLNVLASDKEEAEEIVYNLTHDELDEYEDTADMEIERRVIGVKDE